MLRKWLIFSVFCLIGGIVCWWSFYGERVDSEKAGENYTTLRFEQDSLDLGRVVLGKSKEVVFQYINTGTYPLIVKNVQTTCGCTIVDWSRKPLKPGENGKIKIVFNAEHEGHFIKSVFVVCNIWKKVYQLYIEGIVAEE